MGNKKIIALEVGAMVLALAAGLTLGFGLARVSHAQAEPVSATDEPGQPHRSWLSDQLALTPQQRDQMRAIWSKVAQGAGPDFGEKRRTLQKERDDAIANLIPASQKPAYEQIERDYRAKADALDAERGKAFDAAVAQTKQILDPTQRQKYEEILKHRGEHGHGPRPHGPDHDGPAPSWTHSPEPSSTTQEQP
jgi:Spy/CpxP family protein refolding chaperone